MDPGLRCASMRYHRFVRRLHKCGMIDFDDGGDAACKIGLFAVTETGNKQRLVLDCRTASFYFTDPPVARLPTEAGRLRLALPLGEVLYPAQLGASAVIFACLEFALLLWESSTLGAAVPDQNHSSRFAFVSCLWVCRARCMLDQYYMHT